MDALVGACAVFLSLAGTVVASEWCTTNGGLYLELCAQQCCGYWPDQYCCLYTWFIPVVVVGGILFISGVVCCICFLANRPSGGRGAVVQPAPTVAYVNTGQPNYGYQPAPPGYNQQPAPGYNQQPAPGYTQPQGYNQYPQPNVPGMPQQGPAHPPPTAGSTAGNENKDGKTT